MDVDRAGAAAVSLGVPERRHRSWLIWTRLKRDRLALASGIFLVLLVTATAIGPPILSVILRHGPNDPLPYAVNENLKPVGPWTRVIGSSTTIPGLVEGGNNSRGAKTTLLILGGDGPLGRDMLERLLVGGRVSLEVAFGASLLAVLIGLVLGGLGGYYGGWVDAVIGRLTDFVMAFPLLLLLLLLGNTIGNKLSSVTLHGLLQPGVMSLILLIGSFAWFYPARIVRGEVSDLKNRDFVEAARMVGGSEWRILRVHIFPHLVPVLLAYSSFLVASNILVEAGLSFLNVGVRLPTASWGTLLTSAWGTYRYPHTYDPTTMTIWMTLCPTLAILTAAYAWTMFGEGLRRALAPGSR
jgi:peptide/nickel transport system permease protein